MLNKSILIVERDPEEAVKLVDFFHRHHFHNRIDVVNSKAEALEYIFETGKYKDRAERIMPGLILLDLLTEKTKDIAILNPLHVYLRTYAIPIIILTSSEEQEKKVVEIELGSIGFIRKPLNFASFIEVIQHLGMKWIKRYNY